jgi:heme A synthase
MEEIKRNLPRDVFLHLLAIVTLYWSAISFVTLLWQYVNYFFPDALKNYYYYNGINGPMRFAISSLIIVFPVFILVSWWLNKIYAKEAAVRESKIRKWLIYLTLFIAALVIIGDLITVINIFLGGEITTRFILKALSILLVAAFIFGYYLNDVRKDSPTKLAKPFAIASIIIVLVSVVGAFFIVGSPQSARLIQFDEQKVSDLQQIQSQIIYYWQRKQVLPNSLDDLKDPLSSYMISTTDPQTDQAYEYYAHQDTAIPTFELCATFNRESKDSETYRKANLDVNSDWYHSAGRMCFTRTIDIELYPPYSTIK